MADKVTKASVDYSPGHPPDGDYCGVCMHYHADPNRKSGECTKVQGMIEARMWCKLFKKKQ